MIKDPQKRDSKLKPVYNSIVYLVWNVSYNWECNWCFVVNKLELVIGICFSVIVFKLITSA